MSNTANRVIKNSLYLYAKMGITMFVSLCTTRLILNSLGTSDFGIYNIVGGAISMLGFLNAAMASATQRFMSFSEGEGDKEKLIKIFNISFLIHIVLSVLVGIVLCLSGLVFFHGILNIPEDRMFASIVVYCALIISTMLTVSTVPYEAVLNAHENMRYFAFVGVLESLLKLGVAFACVYASSDKLIVYGCLMACIPFVTLTIMRVYCHKHYMECKLALRKNYDKTILKDMLTFAGWNFLGCSASMIGNYGRSIVINYFFGVLLNAAFGIVQQVYALLTVLTNNLQKALKPVIVKKAAAGDNESMLSWCFTGCKFSYMLTSFAAIPFTIEADYFLRLWLKEVPEWTVVLFQLQMIRVAMELMVGSVKESLLAKGEIKAINIFDSVSYFIALVVMCVLFYIGYSPAWSINTMIILIFIQSCYTLYNISKYCNLNIVRYAKGVAMPLLLLTILSYISGLLVTKILQPSILRVLIVSIMTVLIQVICAITFVTSKEEKTILKSIIKHK